ncbi:MAG: hypothetical protein AAGM21_01785 [Pseudomonadota bacterium]
MTDTKNSRSAKSEMFEILGSADPFTEAIFALTVIALHRKDEAFALEIKSAMHRSHQDAQPDEMIDEGLLSGLRAVCPHSECIWWARAFTFSKESSSSSQLWAVVSLARRRIAN